MKDRPLKGIAYMAIAVFLIIVMNMFGKMVSHTHYPVEIVFWRNLVGLIIVLGIIVGTRQFHLMKTKRPIDHLVRAIGGTCGIGLVFWAYSLMPMADVVAIMFTAGLMTTAMSALFLKERVGPWRWSAVAAGFIGAIITVNPANSNMQLDGVLVALGAAFIGGAVVSTMLRSLGKTEPALTTVFYFLTIGVIITFPALLWFGKLPDQSTIWPLLGCGIAGGISLIFKTEAFRYAEASLLSPVHYTSIIWATLFGWLVWQDWPTTNVFIGAGIIIAANLLILWREHHKKQVSTDSNQIQ